MVFGLSPAVGQQSIGTGPIIGIYQQHCAACHGPRLAGGLGGSLLAPQLKRATDDASMAAIIREGLPDVGKEGFGEVLSEETIRALVIYIREARQVALQAPAPESQEGIYASQHHDFRLETVDEFKGEIWGMVFLPDRSLLYTDKGGELRLHEPSGETRVLQGTPEIWVQGQGGLLDVALHPDFAETGWIYLAYAARTPAEGRSRPNQGMTVVSRGRIEAGQWRDHEVLWESPPEFHSGAAHHFGTRLVFHDGYLFFPVGDRGQQDLAQSLRHPQGKMHRIHDDGRVPEDNPFRDHPTAYPTIWSWGHRNPQGMDLHPETGELWSSEHGPRGGDEINLIQRGENYGWPVVTHGLNYRGTPITALTEKEGMVSPVLHWTPSIAVCGISFYRGEAFPAWRNDLFVTGLASQQLHRLRIRDREVVEEEILLRGVGRLRAVVTGPEGALYLAVNLAGAQAGTSRILRLLPVSEPRP